VPEEGQHWTTLEELAATHRNELRRDSELWGVGTEPSLAIGQRALLVPLGDRLVMWDCVTCFDGAAADEIERRGGLAAIAISHPHYYSGMADWAARFDCPVLLHAADAHWITRPHPAIELWDGDTREIGDGLTLVHCGGHFAGGTVLHWPAGAGGAGALLSGDIVQVIPDRAHVGFMYSYPNLIPLPEAAVDRIAAALEPFDYEVIYGAWWDRVVRRDAKEVVRRSAQRYRRALRGELAP
jgi:glyoxylase-like metal-dependent hydrolase (beta-lactamase superfamily II)